MTANTALKIVKPVRVLDPKNDLVFKKIFGQHPELIKAFLNGVMPFPEDRLIETIEYLTPQQIPQIVGMKHTIVDVKCTDNHGRIFIVEMQMYWSSVFMKRFLISTSQAVVHQVDSGKQYHKLCPVYGLAILNECFDETEDWFHHYRILNVKKPDKALEGLEMIFLELPKFKPQTFQHRKLGALWLRFLTEIKKGEEFIPPEFQEDPNIAKAVALTLESSFTSAELHAYNEVLRTISEEQMWLDDAEEKGIKKGREKERIENIKIMIAGGMKLETISELMGFSMDELQQIAKENQSQERIK